MLDDLHIPVLSYDRHPEFGPSLLPTLHPLHEPVWMVEALHCAGDVSAVLVTWPARILISTRTGIGPSTLVLFGSQVCGARLSVPQAGRMPVVVEWPSAERTDLHAFASAVVRTVAALEVSC